MGMHEFIWQGGFKIQGSHDGGGGRGGVPQSSIGESGREYKSLPDVNVIFLPQIGKS